MIGEGLPFSRAAPCDRPAPQSPAAPQLDSSHDVEFGAFVAIENFVRIGSQAAVDLIGSEVLLPGRKQNLLITAEGGQFDAGRCGIQT